MIYEFIERLEDLFKAIIHFFRAMFCRYYRQGECVMEKRCLCRYWNCPNCGADMRGADNE